MIPYYTYNCVNDNLRRVYRWYFSGLKLKGDGNRFISHQRKDGRYYGFYL